MLCPLMPKDELPEWNVVEFVTVFFQLKEGLQSIFTLTTTNTQKKAMAGVGK